MKRLVSCLFICVLLISVFPIYATSTSYFIPELEMRLSLPDSYYVVTEDTPEDAPIFTLLQVSKDEIVKQNKENGVYLDSVSADFSYSCMIAMEDNLLKNLSSYLDSMLDPIVSALEKTYNAAGLEITEYTTFHHPQADFIKLYLYNSSTNTFYLQYYTIHNYQAITITMSATASKITSEMESELSAIIDSIRFIADPYIPPTTEAPDAPKLSVYTDEESGASFSLPETWIFESPDADHKTLDAKFISPDDPTCIIIYGSQDVWSTLTLAEQSITPRYAFNLDMITKEEIAQELGSSVSDVSTVYYNGTRYYSGPFTQTYNIGDQQISLTMTWFFTVQDGWSYLFQFGGTKDSPYYSVFTTMMSSVSLPEPSYIPPETTPTRPPITEPAVVTEPPTLPITFYPPTTHRVPVVPNDMQVDYNSYKNSMRASSPIYMIIISAVSTGVVALVIWIKRTMRRREEAKAHAPSLYTPDNPPQESLEKTTCPKCGHTYFSYITSCPMCGAKTKKEDKQ